MFRTGTSVDNINGISSQSLGGLPPGLVVVYDESPGYVAVTEFCARVAAASQPTWTIWLDPRYHIGEGDLLRRVPGLPGEFVIIAPPGGINVETFDSLAEWLVRGQWLVDKSPKLVVVDSLPAIVDGAEKAAEVAATVGRMRALCQEHGSLLLVGSYGVWGPRGMAAICSKSLNAQAHTQVRVRHEGGKFGVAVPICRYGVPQHEFEWTEAYLNVGE